MAGKIIAIIPGSIAEEISIEPGDILVAINDQPINDLIDYNFYSDEEYLDLTIEKPSGELWLCSVEKFADEELGLVFGANVFDGIRRCCNHCLFCFIDQLQPVPRRSLLVKDDDYRMSFLAGNFITCTNMKDEDYQRIASLKLSPLYISVHTIDPLLRQKMLGLKHPAEIMLTLQRLIALGCRLHTQIVLCPGINDGDHLATTLDALASLTLAKNPAPTAGGILSVAVVPVGITKYQMNPQLRTFTADEATAIIADIEQRQQQSLAKTGRHLVYAADELYLQAGLPFPAAESYEGFAQLENGVGMAAFFAQQWQLCQADIPATPCAAQTAVITGSSGFAVLQPIIHQINQISHSNITLLAVENDFYGPSVTVSGLLTASCLIKAIPPGQYQRIIIPSCMLKHDEDIFLDDLTLPQLGTALNSRVIVASPTAKDLLKAIFS